MSTTGDRHHGLSGLSGLSVLSGLSGPDELTQSGVQMLVFKSIVVVTGGSPNNDPVVMATIFMAFI